MIHRTNLLELVGVSPAIKLVKHLIQQVAKTDTTVLILGESGTGKELVARILHTLSTREKNQFVPVNCAAIPIELLESELFGHEKGAFTSAYALRQGRFEMAAAGTVFLDEIGDMPLSMQAKLLRVLQEKTFERVGSNKSIHADVRVIAATHKDLEASLTEEKFRADLYYRLNVFPIEIPPLRERREDIALLIHHFIQEHQEKTGYSFTVLPEALAFLEHYAWPGNVRELSNLMERLSILFPGKAVSLEDFPEHLLRYSSKRNDKNLTIMTTPEMIKSPETHFEKPHFDLKEHLTQLEFSLITQALNESSGIVARAAKKLGLRRTTLVEKMKKLGIGREINYKIQSKAG